MSEVLVKLLKDLKEAENKNLLKRLVSPEPNLLLIQLPWGRYVHQERQQKLCAYLADTSGELLETIQLTEGMDFQDYQESIVLECRFKEALPDGHHWYQPNIAGPYKNRVLEALKDFRKAMNDHNCSQCDGKEEKEKV